MNKTVKIFLTIVGILILVSVIGGVFKAITGNYFVNASFITSALMIVGAIALIVIVVIGIKNMWTLPAVLLMALVFQACSYAKSNQQVVISTDCGMTWKKVNIGDAVPTGTGNRCFIKVVMPNFPMQGESKFVSNFKEKVRANIHIDYDYSITEPLSFIKQAKYLGRANANADDTDALDPAAFETAENSVIDKRLREVVKALLISEDIVDADQADLENVILSKSNSILNPLGVNLNFITLTFDLDEQTRQAIDVATAMKIYETKNLGEVGRAVITARAGATKVVVENKTGSAPPEEK
jgi:hypothetical protein